MLSIVLFNKEYTYSVNIIVLLLIFSLKTHLYGILAQPTPPFVLFLIDGCITLIYPQLFYSLRSRQMKSGEEILQIRIWRGKN